MFGHLPLPSHQLGTKFAGLELTGNVSSVGNVTSVSSKDGHKQLAEVRSGMNSSEGNKSIGWLIVGEGIATLLKRDIYLYYCSICPL